MNIQSNNACKELNRAQRLNVIRNAAQRNATRESIADSEALECYNVQEVSDCFHFVAESMDESDT